MDKATRRIGLNRFRGRLVEGIEALERPQTLKSSGALSTDEPLVRSFAFLYEAPISPNVINTMKPSDETLNKVHYAGFFRRVAAFLIDAIIMTTIGCWRRVDWFVVCFIVNNRDCR